jgi:hypothetical protein
VQTDAYADKQIAELSLPSNAESFEMLEPRTASLWQLTHPITTWFAENPRTLEVQKGQKSATLHAIRRFSCDDPRRSARPRR